MKNFKLIFALSVALGSMAFAVSEAEALTLTTSDLGYTGPIIDLTAFQNGNYNFTFGPLSLPGGITFTAAPGGGGNSGNGSVVGQGSYGLGSNGSFGGNATYIGVDSATGFDTLTFANPVSSFGAFWNYCPTCGGDAPFISAFDSLNNLLGTFDLATLAPISTPAGFNLFEFRGITSLAADIKSVQFGGSYLLLAGSPDGTIPTPNVPLPAALPLLAGALGGLGAMSRRRKSKLA
jgi:hypothetical protein